MFFHSNLSTQTQEKRTARVVSSLLSHNVACLQFEAIKFEFMDYYILRFICNLLSVLTDDFKCSAVHCGIDLPGYAKNREYK